MLEFDEKDILRALRRDNPWWDGREIPGLDTFHHRRIYMDPFAALAQNRGVRRSVILMGPRRVGKTVMLLQFIRDRIAAGIPGNAIFFASLDNPLYSGIPLERLLELFVAARNGAEPDKAYVIFDEIQYLKDWEVHLKVLTDRHPNIRFIASGSAAAALRLKSQESGAGRFTEFLLPPLSFLEFLQFKNLTGPFLDGEDARPELRDDPDYIAALNTHFLDYLNYGGYPETVFSDAIRADIQRFVGRDIIDKVLLRDLPSLYGIQDIQELNRLFATIAYHTGMEINLESLATRSGVAKNTIVRYLEYLEAAFLIVRLRRIDENGKTFQRMRNFKVYLTNPSMRAALYGPVDTDDPAIGRLVETAIVGQLFHNPEIIRNLHYARWKSGRQDREVDLVLLDPASLKPHAASEIKWSDRVAEHPEEMQSLAEFVRGNDCPAAQMTSRSVWRRAAFDGVEVEIEPSAVHCRNLGRAVLLGVP